MQAARYAISHESTIFDEGDPAISLRLRPLVRSMPASGHTIELDSYDLRFRPRSVESKHRSVPHLFSPYQFMRPPARYSRDAKQYPFDLLI